MRWISVATMLTLVGVVVACSTTETAPIETNPDAFCVIFRDNPPDIQDILKDLFPDDWVKCKDHV